ncbi:MAG TPA: response regulator, partial [Candidatus Mediterraneibacter tabaqchaliae]|nr:response regulator [Candidatus Mediterraneibacter tabaqchaliae]
MYKLLIVDDEKIEREGMAEFIDWNTYGIEIAGTAWNGQAGYEKVLETHPDIVMTDIKMPVMDGIGLIRKLKEEFPDIQVIVLSGYGEYEYTSQAMEMGVKYYILKPCDEERMLPVIEKVKDEIEKKKLEKRKYDTTVKKLLPLAKEQVFRNILLNRETSRKEYDIFLGKMGEHKDSVSLLGFRNPAARFDALEQFVIENVLSELYGGENILMETAINKDVLFLIGERDIEKVEKSVERIREEFSRVNGQAIQVALSDTGAIEHVSALYTQVRELFQIGSPSDDAALLYPERLSGFEGHSAEFFRLDKMKAAKDYADIL